MVPIPAARSLSIITSFLFQRSTRAPATGYTRMLGNTKASPVSASAVAVPVSSHAHMVNAKLVMAEPSIDVNWPSQMIVKPLMPVRGLCFFSMPICFLFLF